MVVRRVLFKEESNQQSDCDSDEDTEEQEFYEVEEDEEDRRTVEACVFFKHEVLDTSEDDNRDGIVDDSFAEEDGIELWVQTFFDETECCYGVCRAHHR